MEFRIADTFTDSLARLTGDEQKAVKIAALDLQLNPAHPSLQLHKLEKSKDKRFWSARVGSDVRLIVHRAEDSMLLCYAGHHDAAYQWAEKRRLETHPKTGAAQLVELRETVQEVFIPKYVETTRPRALPVAHISDSELLSYGVPPAWLSEVKSADEDTILAVAAHLPAEAAEAVLCLAVGAKPRVPASMPAGTDPFEHPDAQRRFRVMKNVEELELALAYPWEKWAVFLHPEQQHMVERQYNGPARVSGSAGTGKTIVALHRAVFVARQNPEARVLLTTFSDTLANTLRAKLRLLISSAPQIADRIEALSLDAVAQRLYSVIQGHCEVADTSKIRTLIATAILDRERTKFSPSFLLSEWEHVVDAWQLKTWESYRDVTRLGRKTRLTERQRMALWQVFAHVLLQLEQQGLITRSGIFASLADRYLNSPAPFDFVVTDEAQDIGVAQLRFLAALAGTRKNALFFAGDLGQRIFQQPFSWSRLGVDVRGWSLTLKINYRTSHQIRQNADRLLGPEMTDVDGNKDERGATISLFNGPPPTIQVLASERDECTAVSEWLKQQITAQAAPGEIGIFVRSPAQLVRARTAVEAANLPFSILDDDAEPSPNRASVSTMHLAKGLEFKAVVVMACDDEVIPLQARIETAADKGELEEVYATERHLLYVACTRGRDHLLVTGVKPASEFLGDLGQP